MFQKYSLIILDGKSIRGLPFRLVKGSAVSAWQISLLEKNQRKLPDILFYGMIYSKSLQYNKIVSRSFDDVFSIDRSGMYALEITASAKSWWQNVVGRRSFLNKDSLAILLDGHDVISIQKKRKLPGNI